MLIRPDTHLTYCTNIHPGDGWKEVLAQLERHLPVIRKRVCPAQPFGVGLRLSDLAARELGEPQALAEFKEWLQESQLYVFTMNGFVHGGFHHAPVKDKVHTPDWTSPERVAYTGRMADLLKKLLPEGMEGGISTSPLGYRFHYGSAERLKAAQVESAKNLCAIAKRMDRIYSETGKLLHVDIEPEPDGLLGNSRDAADYFARCLLPEAKVSLGKDGQEILLRHIRLCYDICHAAVEYEDHVQSIQALLRSGVQIGKIQISSALKVNWTADGYAATLSRLTPFAESVYLHQTVIRKPSGQLQRLPDLPEAIDSAVAGEGDEWRIHFHVPIFMESYNELSSTRADIEAVLGLFRNRPFTRHLEVETYTWEVLPQAERLPVSDSICRELEWVKGRLA